MVEEQACCVLCMSIMTRAVREGSTMMGPREPVVGIVFGVVTAMRSERVRSKVPLGSFTQLKKS